MIKFVLVLLVFFPHKIYNMHFVNCELFLRTAMYQSLYYLNNKVERQSSVRTTYMGKFFEFKVFTKFFKVIPKKAI